MEKKLDLRIQKTHKALIKALQELLCEKSFDEITVTELCARAETRKATFYKHFGDKFELFIFMVKELQRAYDENYKKYYTEGNVQSYYAGIFRHILDFLEENERLVLTVLSSTARGSLIDLIAQQSEYTLKLRFKEDEKRNGFHLAEPELLASAYTGALVQSACWWILNKNRFSKEEIIEQFSNLIKKI